MKHRQHGIDGGADEGIGAGGGDPDLISVGSVRNVPVVHVAGEIDLLTVDQFRAATARALALVGSVPGQSPTPVLVDLTRVTFFSSVGAAVLVEALQRGRVAGVPVRVVAVDGSTVHRSLDMMGILATTGSYPSVDAALAGLSPPG